MWQLGQTSKRYEVGTKGSAATISSGKGDFGGVSYRTLSNVIKTGCSSKVH